MLGIEALAARKAWSFITVALLVWALFIIRKTLLLFILSILFAYLLYPLVAFVQSRLRVKTRFAAAALVFLFIFSIFGTACLSLRRPLEREASNLRTQITSQDFKSNLAHWTVVGIPIGEEIAAEASPVQVQGDLMKAMPSVQRWLARIGRDLSNVILIPILSFFMLKDGEKLANSSIDFAMSLTRREPDCASRTLVTSVTKDAHVLIQEYMKALVFQCVAVLLAFGLALSLMRVRYAIILAFCTFGLEFVPLLGPLAAGVLIIGVCEFNHYQHISWIILFLVVYRLFQDYVLSPQLMNKTIKLHPLLIIFGVFAGGEIGGISGVFLSLPIIAIARLVVYEVLKFRARSAPMPQNQANAAIVGVQG